MNVLLSIVIPSKNRYEYLYYCLLSLLENYNTQEVEIILHDNSTDEMPENVLSLIQSNDIIKYIKVDGWISGWENFEKAIGLANGEYITMLGDDDTLSKYLLEAVYFMKAKGIDALNAPFAHYIWPDIQSRVFNSSMSGFLNITRFTGKLNQIRVNDEIKKMLNSGGTSLGDLPRMYYGIVKKKIIDQVKNSSEFYLPGPSPDMANAVSMAMYVKNLYYIDFPLFIAGNSIKSTAGMGSKGTHVGIIEEMPFLPKDCGENWSTLVPKFWSGPTIWAESALKAMEKTNNERLIQQFNFIKLYASCLVFNSSWNTTTWKTISDYKESKNNYWIFILPKLYFYIFLIWTKRFKMLLKNIFKVFKNKIHKKNEEFIKDVYVAGQKVNLVLKMSNFSLK